MENADSSLKNNLHNLTHVEKVLYLQIKRLLQMKRHIWCIILLFCTAISCTRQSKYSEIFLKIEDLLSNRPDSALIVLQTIDTDNLSSRGEIAKYSLLLSMALDKNYIDTTTFSIIQPAIDYYLEKGSPDEKMRTLYYQGRIFQNRGDVDEAMRVFIRAREVENHCYTDTLTFANLLVAQSTIFYSSYKTKAFIDNNLKAAELYRQMGHSLYAMTSLAKALDGSIIEKNRLLADSILNVCQEMIKVNSEFAGFVIPHLLSYTTVFGTEKDIKQLLSVYVSDNQLQEETKLDIAWAYYIIGDIKNALYYVESVNEEVIAKNYLKHLAIKSKILEANGDYKESLHCYQLYATTLENFHQQLFSQDLLFAQEKHQMELSSMMKLQERNNIIWWSLCCVFALLFILAWIYYRYRNAKLTCEQQNLVKENLRMRIEQLESESENLKEILAELSGPVADVVKSRLEMLNSMMAARISENDIYAKPYNDWLDKMLKDKDSFMDTTRLAFKASHPKFIKYLEDHQLSIYEINYLCLYAIGLRGKDIGEYIQLKRHYHISSDIRKKLGIDEHETNLGIYVRKLMNTL